MARICTADSDYITALGCIACSVNIVHQLRLHCEEEKSIISSLVLSECRMIIFSSQMLCSLDCIVRTSKESYLENPWKYSDISNALPRDLAHA